ncbi:hypothetical protein BDR06DRAFT_950801 [Suillus hirtellus]|nr:hypothetical protein BDR06DRAFT_950801 [Suillus hirtellus]
MTFTQARHSSSTHSTSSCIDVSNSGMPAAPGATDDDFAKPPLGLPPPWSKTQAHQHLSIIKTRSIACANDEDVSEITDAHAQDELEDEYNSYKCQSEDSGSLYSPIFPALTPARPDSIIISHEVAPQAPKPCGRSRSSKAFLLPPLPAPPSTTVPPTTVPPVLQLPVSAYESQPSLCDMPEQAQPPLRMYTLQTHTIGDHDMKQSFRSHCAYLDLVERFRRQSESEVEVGGSTKDLGVFYQAQKFMII